MGQSRDPLLVTGRPATHWIGPEMLVDLMIERRNVNALADSGSQVNTNTPAFIQQCGFPCPATSRLSQPPIEPCRVGWKMHKSAWVFYPVYVGKRDPGV